MPDLEFSERPQLNRTIMIAAFAGWSDASESATRAIRYVARGYGAVRFASIDPEEFFDFTQLRPNVSLQGERRRVLGWPANEFLYWKARDPGARDLVLMVGVEPHLRWRRFGSLVSQVAEATNVELFLSLGALLDAVPHSRPARVMSTSTAESLGPGFENIRLPGSRYEGPTGILSTILDGMSHRGVPCASLWGRAPHYLQVRPNTQVALALLHELQKFLPMKLDLAEIQAAADEFMAGLDRALEGQQQVVEYVKQLEERYDREVAGAPGGAASEPETRALIEELEQFLRRRPNGDQGETNRG
ncbi:MAG: PAC2 family protein [Chloroflexi bacterium]|nr:PAC2 family protein [Chloroflexota bacterium]